MSFGIRRLEDADMASYSAFRRFALGESPRAFSDALEDDEELVLGSSAEHFTLGAFRGDELVAIVTAIRDPRKKARHRLTLSTMYVAPSARRKGLAERLVAGAHVDAEYMVLTLSGA